MALFLPYVPLLLAFVSCPERSIDWSRERLLLLLLSKNKSWKYGWRTFFIVYSKLDFRYWGTLPCYQFTILFAEHNLLQLAYSAFSTTNPRKRNVRFWRKKFTSWQRSQLFLFERTTISLQYELFSFLVGRMAVARDFRRILSWSIFLLSSISARTI